MGGILIRSTMGGMKMKKDGKIIHTTAYLYIGFTETKRNISSVVLICSGISWVSVNRCFSTTLSEAESSKLRSMILLMLSRRINYSYSTADANLKLGVTYPALRIFGYYSSNALTFFIF